VYFIWKGSISGKLNEVEGKMQYHAEISNRFAAFEDLDAKVEINSAWEMNRENITITAKDSLGYCEQVVSDRKGTELVSGETVAADLRES
jgi:hypothetical protein